MKITTRWKKCSALVLFVALIQIANVHSCPDNCRTRTGCNDADGGCSKCKEGWFGRKCDHPLECYIGRGLQYYGTISKTAKNITCKLWTLQPPGNHSWKRIEDQKNYCRNPNPLARDNEPWCYQTSGDRFGYCGVPKCDTQCPVPDLLVYGDVNNPPSSGFVKGFVVDVITGGCGPGSRGKMTCLQNATWSAAFDCKAIPDWCTNPPAAVEPAFTQESRKEFHYQDKIAVLCRPGHEIVGNDDHIICQADKSWSPIPQCTRVKCNDPVLNENSKLSQGIKSLYEYENELTIACITGYDIIGQTTLKCLANKQWSDALPTCKVVECSQPNLNENSYVLIEKTPYIYEDQISIGCHNGYTIQGTKSFTCGADKLWSGTLPTCDPVPCEIPELPPNTELKSPQSSYVYKDVISLTCKKGYELKKRNTITCLANKTWSVITGCTIVKCKDPELPAYLVILEGNKTEYQYNNIVRVGCRGNYEFNGTNTTICLHTGRWQEIKAECKGYPTTQISLKATTTAEDNTAGSIAGGFIGVVAVIGIVAVIFILYQRKRRDNETKHDGEESQLHSAQGKGRPRSSGLIYENTPAGNSRSEYVNFSAIGKENIDNEGEPDDHVYYNAAMTDGSLKMEDFIDYVKEKTNNDFKSEFMKLKTGLQRPANEASKPENKPKNKYKSIYPYDDNRINLQKLPSVPESDFINASPIKGYSGSMKYVAAQGPQKATVIDFWRMIWELNCGRIVMLTNVVEEGKHKCEHYWPNKDSLKMGAITIEHINTDVYAEFTVRKLAISYKSSRRMIDHFHFTAWPDKSVPSSVYSLAQFRRKVFSTPCHEAGPLVVHCSAGVGRTGTFIALDYLVDEANASGSVNVFACLEKLRYQRVNMVQTKVQYAYLHRVLVEDYECEISKIPSSDFLARYKQLQVVNPATRRSPLEDRFQELGKSTADIPLDEFDGGKRPEVKNKNRYNNMLPVDSYRPFLVGSGSENGDYINAVYLPSYRDKKAFIATQMPLPNTVVDFWTLVYEQDVSLVVMLNQTIDESCGVYWAEHEDKDQNFGPFTVSFVSEQRDKNVIVRTLKVKQESDQPRTVKQLRLPDWPDNTDVPASPTSLLCLMESVQSGQRGKQGTPIVVHCMNGSDKSGLFCTVMTIIDRLKVEHDVVIQQIITQMRTRRPQCIANKEQFQFCYESVSQYIQSFETYSNFV